MPQVLGSNPGLGKVDSTFHPFSPFTDHLDWNICSCISMPKVRKTAMGTVGLGPQGLLGQNREKTRQRGKELLCEGKIKEARECFQRCVDVTPEMAKEVIEACKRKHVDCIVAPYEADAQLAYLNKIGMVQLIITEDSDLILFGCTNIFFKMDNCGGGLLYEKENLDKSFGTKASKFCFEKFRYMCILSGCDYLQSLPGIGLGKACKFFTLTNNLDITNVLPKIPSYLKMPRLTVPPEYIDSFIKANNTFLYQLVFCPQKKALVPLNPYPDDIKPEDVEYAGQYP
ncbi:exonuclease 1 [Trichonephila clavipes]|nr:exonuclease 1 [Trichonephila clavipes]